MNFINFANIIELTIKLFIELTQLNYFVYIKNI